MPERDPKKFDPARASTLDAAEREQYLPSEQLVALLELKGGETVLDYGAGTGRLALAAAAAIPRGRIVAVDESVEMLVHLQDRLGGTANAEVALISANRVPLRDGEADRILAVNLLHEVRGEHALSEMRRVLAPDGILLVVDWERGRRRPGGPPDRLLYKVAEAASELRSAGRDRRDPGRPPVSLRHSSDAAPNGSEGGLSPGRPLSLGARPLPLATRDELRMRWAG